MKLYFMVGIPGSGKSTYAKELSKHAGAVIFSSDVIREEIGADGGDVSKHSEVFKILHNRIYESLLNGNDCIYDATNINRKKREAFLKELNSKVSGVTKICIVMATPVDYCKMFNGGREGKAKVPHDVIDRMYKNWQTPYYAEGWDKIFLHYVYDYFRTCNGTPKEFCDTFYGYDQNNPHHRFSLGIHSLVVGNALFNESYELIVTGLLHDCGKPYVRDTDEDGVSHYYNHQNVGAYEAMFFDYSEYPHIDPIYISFLINCHMNPFGWKDKENGWANFQKRYGKQERNDLYKLHEKDRLCH